MLWRFIKARDARTLCLATNQRLDYFDEIKEWEKRGIDIFNPNYYGCFSGKFYPIVFSERHRQLLQHTHRIVNSKLIAIPRVWDRLIADLQTAVDFDDVLQKDPKTPMDALDSLRCALSYYVIDDTDTDYSSGDSYYDSNNDEVVITKRYD